MNHQPPQLYSLIQLHKMGCPIRSVVSSSVVRLIKYLILSLLPQNKRVRTEGISARYARALCVGRVTVI